jgi:2-haloacid dehalogenase
VRKHYPWLCFDADGTLFDFNKAEIVALKRAFELVRTPFKDEYLEIYRTVEYPLWRALEQREITSVVLKVRRFELLLEATELGCSASQISEAFVEQLAMQSELIEGAYEVLTALRGRSKLAILTNGLKGVQRSRLANSEISNYISELIVSEEIGEAKPKLEFFETAFIRMGSPPKSDVLMIGDSLTSDMQGGVDYGIDTCWYNPAAELRPADLPITYEIEHLSDLLKVLGLNCE